MREDDQKSQTARREFWTKKGVNPRASQRTATPPSTGHSHQTLMQDHGLSKASIYHHLPVYDAFQRVQFPRSLEESFLRGETNKPILETGMINAESYYLRNPDIVAVGTAEHYLFINVDGLVLELHTQHPARWSYLMQTLMVPTRGDTLRRQLSDSLAIDIMDLTPLREQGVLLEASTTTELESRRDDVFTNNQGYHFKRGKQQCAHLVVALTGSIIAGLMGPVILSLCYMGFHSQIDLILTKAALHFTTRDFFEFYGISTWVDAFDRRDGVH